MATSPFLSFTETLTECESGASSSSSSSSSSRSGSPAVGDDRSSGSPVRSGSNLTQEESLTPDGRQSSAEKIPVARVQTTTTMSISELDCEERGRRGTARGFAIAPLTFAELLASIESLSGLHATGQVYLSFSNKMMTDADMTTFCSTVESRLGGGGLQILGMNFSNNQLGDAALRCLAKLLADQRLTGLKSVDVSGNPFTHEGVEALRAVLLSPLAAGSALTKLKTTRTGGKPLSAKKEAKLAAAAALLDAVVASNASLETLARRKDGQHHLLLAQRGLTALPVLELLGGCLDHVQSLDLSGNCFDAAPAELALLPCLRTVDLSGNRIVRLPPELYRLAASLTAVNLAGNRLADVPSWLPLMTALEQLDLSDNRLRKLPVHLGLCPLLCRLELHGNPFDTRTCSTIKALPDGGLPSYLRSLMHDAAHDAKPIARIIVVGNERSGKTTLLSGLQKLSTDGQSAAGPLASLAHIFDAAAVSPSSSGSLSAEGPSTPRHSSSSTLSSRHSSPHRHHSRSHSSSSSSSAAAIAAAVAATPTTTTTPPLTTLAATPSTAASGQVETGSGSSYSLQLRALGNKPAVRFVGMEVSGAGSYEFGTHPALLVNNAVYLVVFSVLEHDAASRIMVWLAALSKLSNVAVYVVITHSDQLADAAVMKQCVDSLRNDIVRQQFKVTAIAPMSALDTSEGGTIGRFLDQLEQWALQHAELTVVQPAGHAWSLVPSLLHELAPVRCVYSADELAELLQQCRAAATADQIAAFVDCLVRSGNVAVLQRGADSLGFERPTYVSLPFLCRLLSAMEDFDPAQSRGRFINDVMIPTSQASMVWPPSLVTRHNVAAVWHILQTLDLGYIPSDDDMLPPTVSDLPPAEPEPRIVIPSLLPLAEPSESEQITFWSSAVEDEVSRVYLFDTLPVGIFGKIFIRILLRKIWRPVRAWRSGAWLMTYTTSRFDELSSKRPQPTSTRQSVTGTLTRADHLSLSQLVDSSLRIWISASSFDPLSKERRPTLSFRVRGSPESRYQALVFLAQAADLLIANAFRSISYQALAPCTSCRALADKVLESRAKLQSAAQTPRDSVDRSELSPWLIALLDRLHANDPDLQKLALPSSELSINEVQALALALSTNIVLFKIRLSDGAFQKPDRAVDVVVQEYLRTGNTANVQIVELHKNGLARLPALFGSAFCGLTHLHLQNNNLKELPDSVAALTKLTVLDVSYNKLTALPADAVLQHLAATLTTLLCQHNKLAALPVYLSTFPLLSTLQVHHNPIRDVPKRLVKDGDHSLLTYLAQHAVEAVHDPPTNSKARSFFNRLFKTPSSSSSSSHSSQSASPSSSSSSLTLSASPPKSLLSGTLTFASPSSPLSSTASLSTPPSSSLQSHPVMLDSSSSRLLKPPSQSRKHRRLSGSLTAKSVSPELMLKLRSTDTERTAVTSSSSGELATGRTTSTNRMLGHRVHLFPLSELVNCITDSKSSVVCPLCQDSIRLDVLAPDIAFSRFPGAKFAFEDLDVVKELGAGSAATVLLANYRRRHKKTGAFKCVQLVAVKKLRAEVAGSVELFAEFRREAWFMTSLQHPNLVRLLGLCLEPLAMMLEYMDCGDLQAYLLEPSHEFGWHFCLDILLDIASGMAFLHNRKSPIIHRDLKSPNVLLHQSPELGRVVAKISDFGLSHVLAFTDHVVQLAHEGLDNCTWHAPEVIAERKFDTRSDVYAFAVIMWELAARRRPFENIEWMWQIEEHVRAGGRLELSPNWLRPYISLMQRCWDQDPANRPDFSRIVPKLRLMLSVTSFPSRSSSSGSFGSSQLVI